MGYAWGLDSMVKPELASKLTPEPFTPTWPACLDKKRSIIEQVCEKDALLMYPYESMDPFVTMLREASVDSSVISIKITLYRLASQSHLAEALLAAAENGKEVTALFELRARFDESNNIEWSQRFEQAGANVIYGFHDFKVHSKICAITRHTDKGIQHITQLGTGNYNEKTSKLYTDFSFITTDESIGKDAAEFFRNMQLENASDRYQTLSVAPLQIKPMILAKIDEQIELARAGKPNGLMFKTNSVTDKDIIDKIAEASQAGVHATLFVRGISCLVPGVEGYTDNVKVVSIVGRLLEHSRIYGFGPRDNREIYLSSADLMTRNMEKRVEIAWPIKNEELKEKVNEYLDISLSDTAKLRMLKNDLEYTPLEFFAAEGPDGIPESFDSQEYLIKKAREDYLHSLEVREEQAAQRSATARVQRIRDREMMTSAATPIVENPETGEPLPGVGNVAPQAEGASAALEVESQEATLGTDAVQAAVASAAGSEAGSNVVAGSNSDAAADAASSVVASADAPASTPASAAASAPTSTSAEGTSVTGGIEEVEPGVAGPAFGATEGQAATQQAATATQQSAPAQAATQTQESTQATPEAEVIPTEQKASEAGAIQLVPKKPSLWTRIKFLFTGKLS